MGHPRTFPVYERHPAGVAVSKLGLGFSAPQIARLGVLSIAGTVVIAEVQSEWSGATPRLLDATAGLTANPFSCPPLTASLRY